MTEAVDYVEALNQRLPVAQYKPRGAAAKTMKALADEIDARLQAAREGVAYRVAFGRSRGGRLKWESSRSSAMNGLGQRRREHGGGGPGPDRPRFRLARCNGPGACRRPGAPPGREPEQGRGPSSRPRRLAPTRRSPARSLTRPSSRSSPSRSAPAGSSSPSPSTGTRARAVYVIVCGERRWRAAKLAGIPTMTATILAHAPEAGERLALQMHREPPQV